MILVDANILVYSHVESFAQHEPARHWLDQQFNGSNCVGLPGVSFCFAFLRLVTNPYSQSPVRCRVPARDRVLI
jgi:predicted nucleic acid-binding protein